MAIDVKTVGVSTPVFKTDTNVTTACTQIRSEAGVEVTILASGAIFLFNGVPDGSNSIPSDKMALSDTEAEQGIKIKVGRPFIGGRPARPGTAGTICVAAQSGTVTVRVIAER